MLNKREREYLKFTLNEEKKTLRELEKLYEEALKSINEKIPTLLARRDIENIDSIIYRLDYQKALKTQINAILDNLNANQYESIEKYLLDSYKNGFIGTMYDLHGQGIPLMIPIDQEQVLNALTIDSKLSECLYKRLGEDITILKKKIRHEISRGIASAMSYADITRNISNISKIGINNAYRIARTEGHRIQNQSSFDAMNKAKEKGAEVVKQWDATLDGRTRKTHRELDGKIVEVDEPFIFNDHKAMYPGGFGVASLDINCRCAVLTRAKWELDEEELNTLKDRASYFGLDKAKNFKDFKEKYLKVIENNDKDAKMIIETGASYGAYNDNNDPDGSKRDKHAISYYDELRNRNKADVIATLSKNTGFNVDIIVKAYDHILINKYQLANGYSRFYPNYDMAVSLQRLLEGKDIKNHDLVLMQHEAMEYDLMNKYKLPYNEAHAKTNEKYNYQELCDKFNEKQKKGKSR